MKDRSASLAMLMTAVMLSEACSSGNVRTLEMDLADLSDGSGVITPGSSQRRSLERRCVERGPEALAEALRLGEGNPRLTYAAFRIIADILIAVHPGPFSVPRAGPDRDYWVIRWPTGEGLIVLEPRDVMKERDQVLRAFRTWLSDHGYIVDKR